MTEAEVRGQRSEARDSADFGLARPNIQYSIFNIHLSTVEAPRPARNRRKAGLTLVEVMMAVVILGMALGGLVTATDRRFRQPARAARQEAA